LHKLLESLTEQVVSGELEPYPASVAGSLIGVRLRLLEYDRRVREEDELLARIEQLEQAQEQNKHKSRREVGNGAALRTAPPGSGGKGSE
jgi:hypothetical protein